MILPYYNFLRVRGVSLVVSTRRSSLYNVISKYSPAVYNNFVFSISSSGPHFSSIWPGADNFLKCWTKSCAVVVFPSWTSLHWARSRVARAIFPRFRANFAAVRPSSIRWLLIGTVGSEEESKTKNIANKMTEPTIIVPSLYRLFLNKIFCTWPSVKKLLSSFAFLNITFRNLDGFLSA